MLPLLAVNVQGPCKSCWVVFPSSSSSINLWGSRAACAALLNSKWCRPSHIEQARKDRCDPFFAWKTFSLSHQLLLQDAYCLHTSLCSALGNCRPTWWRAEMSVHPAELGSLPLPCSRSMLRVRRVAPDFLYPQTGEDDTDLNIFWILLFLFLPSPTHFLFLPSPSCYKAAR